MVIIEYFYDIYNEEGEKKYDSDFSDNNSEGDRDETFDSYNNSNNYFLFIGLVNSAKLPSTLRSYAYPLFQVWHICVTLRILNLSNSLLLLLNHKYIMIPCTICRWQPNI